MKSTWLWTMGCSFFMLWLIPLCIGASMLLVLGSLYLLAPLGVNLDAPFADGLAFLGIQTLQVAVTTPLLVLALRHLAQRSHSGWAYLWAVLLGWLLPLLLHMPYVWLMGFFQPAANRASLLSWALVVIGLAGPLLGSVCLATLRRAQRLDSRRM